MAENLQRFIYSADSTFQIGEVHVKNVSPCQDFADNLVTKTGDKVYLGTSDGCSTGGQTDVGSRFIARRQYTQAKMLFGSAKSVSKFPSMVGITKADLDFLGLEPSDVFATSLTCFADQHSACVDVYGDGVVVFEYEDGSFRLRKFEWANNTPHYPLYTSELGRQLGLYDLFAARHQAIEFPFSQTDVLISGGQVVEEKETKFTLEEGVEGVRIWLNVDDLTLLSAIGLFSDGVTQVNQFGVDRPPLDWKSVALECMGFKNTMGGFLKRRVRRAIQGWAKQGFAPQDDVSGSVALIQKPPIQP